MRRHLRTARAVLGTSMCVLCLIGLTPGRASADYRAWFTDWDHVGIFHYGDISEGFDLLEPPPSACGLRIQDPSYYRWTDDFDNTISSNNLGKDVIIWIDGGGDCTEPFSVQYYDGSHTFNPPGGIGVSIDISTNYGAYWVNNEGGYLYTCGGDCVDATDILWRQRGNIWPLVTVAGFEAVGDAILDPRRQSGAGDAVAQLVLHVAELQRRHEQRVVDRRKTPLGEIEKSMSSLENAATGRLAEARKAATSCESLARRGFYLEAFAACTKASRQLEQGEALMQTAWFLYQPPKAKR